MSLEVHGAEAGGTTESTAVVLRDTTARPLAARTPRREQLLSISPMERRLIVAAARVGVNLADGMLLSGTVANPLLSVALVAYESFRAVDDYRRGEPNALGHRTRLTDVALRVGKEVGTVAIGYAVGALIGLCAIPFAGQIAVTTVLSVALGICVGTLLTRYVDRVFIRFQLQAQYGYSRNEEKSRRRFEQLLGGQHDLSSFETCKIVQHYRDYRVACGWEGQTDIDDYRATADITMMPISFQHFAIVQLQRKWGFLNEYNECKKVYKSLLLLHHPDKGGDSEIAAQLNHDYEIYAFCQGWQNDCLGLYQRGSVSESKNTSSSVKKRKKNVIVDFLRSLFRPVSNSVTEAEDLRQYGLLALEAGTPSELHRLDEVNWEIIEKSDVEEVVEKYENPVFGTCALVKQQSVSRILASIHRSYQLASEAITFSCLMKLYKEKEEWLQLEKDIFLFNRVQIFIHTVDHIFMKENHNDSSYSSCAMEGWSCFGIPFKTKQDAVEKREECREAILCRCFPPYVSSKLQEALELWKTAQGLVKSFFKQCNNSGKNNEKSGEIHVSSDGTEQILDTLLNIQKSLKDIMNNSEESWRCMNSSGRKNLEEEEKEEEEFIHSSFIEQVKAIGLTASCALAGAHAIKIEESLWKLCEDFFRGRRRKLESVTSLLNEIHDLEAPLKRACKEEKDEERELLQSHHDNCMKQIFGMHYLFGEIDASIVELCDIYTLYLPEKSQILKTLPSSCALCIHEDFYIPRFVQYERERTLINYMNLEVEPRNVMDPSRSPADHENHLEHEGKVYDDVQFSLIRGQYVDSINGTVTPCWLKRYTFPKIEEGIESTVKAKELLQHIMKEELHIPDLCITHRITCVMDVFSDDYKREIYFHIPRGGTQLRFCSTHDVKRRIMRFGVRWLHDALQCIIDLHSCQLIHGTISLSSFTYDDFGNTTLGFFSSAINHNCIQKAPSQLDDVVNFAATLHAEVIPYLIGIPDSISPVRQSPVASKREDCFLTSKQNYEELVSIYREVADRLIGKVEPRWTLLDARTFVRRFLEFSYNSDERNYLFTKEVSYPANWAIFKTSVPISLIVDRRVFLFLSSKSNVFLNRNLHLWEVYWKCRRKMVQERSGGFFSMPAELKRYNHFLPCADDCEVNERFLWHPCVDEEEAWQICIKGLASQEKIRLRLLPPWIKKGLDGKYCSCQTTEKPNWGVIFRVSLGTVVLGGDGETVPSSMENEKTTLSRTTSSSSSVAYNLERSAKQRCVIFKSTKAAGGDDSEENVRDWSIEVHSPFARCYPEYVVLGVGGD